jgi:4'-phosphopantetheinyl transferase EntD
MTLVQPLFDRAFVTAEAEPRLVDEQLFPEELACLTHAVPKRRAEFGTARVCARRALAELGIAALELSPAADRSPRWPAGVVGSISHTARYCAVVIGRADRWLGVGLDVEQDRALSAEVIARICTPRERAILQARDPQLSDAALYFSAKEAFYKCQYGVTRAVFEFQQVELQVNFEAQTFRVEVHKQWPARPSFFDELEGTFRRRDGLVLTGIALARG